LKEQRKLINTKGAIEILIAAILIVACLAGHILSIWNQKFVLIFFTFLFLSPLVAWLLIRMYPRLKNAYQEIKRRRGLFIVSALIWGSLAALAAYQPPISYQTVTLKPLLTAGQQVELLEIKVGGNILSIEKKARPQGWSENDHILSATQYSQPLQITFLSELNSEINILLNTSPKGGRLLVSLGGKEREVNLDTPIQQQKLITFRSNYRTIPPWLFIPFIIIADIFAFSLFFFLLFILQEKGQKYFVEDPQEKFPSKRVCILSLVVLASVLHLLNALAVPLIVSSDSPSYLRGAVHLLKYGNFNGVSLTCGPGTTFLFAPVLFLFGRNPWGMKIFLHLIAIGCVLLNFRLGWQLSKKRWIAFSVAFITMLLPDLYYYANFIMSDLINIFLILLFSTLLIDALEKNDFKHLLLLMLVGSFATLLRAENLLLLPIGIFCLGFPPAWDWLKGMCKKKNKQPQQSNLHSLKILFLALLIALLPLLWWSNKNYQLTGDIILDNSSGMVLYDGWVYYTEASGLDFQDDNSPAVQEIRHWINVYPIEATDREIVATSVETYSSLIKAGYSSQEAIDLLEKAAVDSIKANRALIPKILTLKFKDAFKPRIYHTLTYPLEGETAQFSETYLTYFDPSIVSIPFLINAQRSFYEFFYTHLASIYRTFTLFSLAAAFFSLYRRPFLQWFTLVILVLTRIFISNLISIAMWRYTIAGIGLLVVFSVLGVAVLYYGFKDTFLVASNKKCQ